MLHNTCTAAVSFLQPLHVVESHSNGFQSRPDILQHEVRGEMFVLGQCYWHRGWRVASNSVQARLEIGSVLTAQECACGSSGG